ARSPKVAWEEILPQVRATLGTEEVNEDLHIPENDKTTTDFGVTKVFIQFFRGIPIQVKLEEDDGEKRFGLPEMFQNAIMKASAVTDNIIFDRKWVEQDPRYGNSDEIGKEVVEELTATYDEARLNQLVELALLERD